MRRTFVGVLIVGQQFDWHAYFHPPIWFEEVLDDSIIYISNINILLKLVAMTNFIYC